MHLTLHPLAGGSPQNLFARIHTYGVDREHRAKLIPAFTMGILGQPSRFLVKRLYQQKLDAVNFTEDPIIILGHWRSGTTYLHHLLSLDPAFCYVSSFHAWLPELFILNDWFGRNMVKLSMPDKRPMDNIELSLNKPEEEEFPLATTPSCSYIDSFYFPKNTREIFDHSVSFKSLSANEHEQWKLDYLRILKFSYLSMPGNRLLLKSPANTARIPTLLELFPKAKFIHLYRNPYEIFASKLHTLKQMNKAYGLQIISEAELEENVFWIYREVMGKFFEDQVLISPENLIELRYEAFIVDPLSTLSSIYTTFQIDSFAAALPQLSQYVDAQKKYQKNPYQMPSETIAKIYQNWSFTIDKWGYEPPT
ncbi:MAG: sulfotransferase [Synechococcales cyanobacterium CRU_2_2]|nr:sulfotransferase [Synechococcales cyanobacterium CRU_2_2]